MTEPFVLVVPGVPSTDHRARSMPYLKGGRARVRHHRSAEYDAWKKLVALAGNAQRPAGWRLDGWYAVEVMGFLTAARSDADNLRGAVDALEGVLWKNDRRCKPVTYDYQIDKLNPRVEVTVVPYDPKAEIAENTIVIRPRIMVRVAAIGE